MEVLLVVNNLLETRLMFEDKNNIDEKKKSRPLSVTGERIAKTFASSDEASDINLIYSSEYASSIGSAKYIADRLNKKINIKKDLNDAIIGELDRYTFKSIIFMQNHDFDIKLKNGESLNEVSTRAYKAISGIINNNPAHKIVIFTHRRIILGYLMKHGQIDYNNEDDLVIEYKDKIIYDGKQKDIDIIKLSIKDKNITNIEMLDVI